MENTSVTGMENTPATGATNGIPATRTANNIPATGMTDTLLASVSTEDLVSLETKYPQLSIPIQAELARREAVATATKVKADFEAKVAKFINLPNPPEGIHNILLTYREVELEEAVEIPIIKKQAVLNSKGRIITPAVVETEMRKPKVMRWIPETNHVCKITGKSGKNQPANKSTSSHTIRLHKRDEDFNLKLVGEYPSGEEACRQLKIDSGVGSANKALQTFGYIVEKVKV